MIRVGVLSSLTASLQEFGKSQFERLVSNQLPPRCPDGLAFGLYRKIVCIQLLKVLTADSFWIGVNCFATFQIFKQTRTIEG